AADRRQRARRAFRRSRGDAARRYDRHQLRLAGNARRACRNLSTRFSAVALTWAFAACSHAHRALEQARRFAARVYKGGAAIAVLTRAAAESRRGPTPRAWPPLARIIHERT